MGGFAQHIQDREGVLKVNGLATRHDGQRARFSAHRAARDGRVQMRHAQSV
jgi:hypothetical protein